MSTVTCSSKLEFVAYVRVDLVGRRRCSWSVERGFNMRALPFTCLPLVILFMSSRCFPSASGSNPGSKSGESCVDAVGSALVSYEMSRSKSASFLLLKLSGKHSGTLTLLLLFSGNIERNPGPKQPKYPCGMCSRAVKSCDPAVNCDQCGKWVHNQCSGLSAHMYERMKQSCGVWICPSCGLPSFNSSLFDSSVETNNSFGCLSETNNTMGIGVLKSTSTPVKCTKSSKPGKLKVISINVNGLRS